jgi:Lamin Tail Domain/Putative Ig domain
MQSRLNGKGVSSRNALGAGLLGLLLTGAGFPSHLSAQVVINEILASNASAVDNGDDFPDYVELYNLTASPVNLGGMRLTDDPLDPLKFRFPADTIIGPGGFLLVWGDSKTNSPGIHVGFGMNDKGESLRLISADGFTVLDAVTFGLQLEDLSLGRIPNGIGAWTLNAPTPEKTNEAEPLAAPDRLFINEWLALNVKGNGNLDDDWLEIYNATNKPAALGRLHLSDSSTNHAIPDLSFIGPNGFLQFIADDQADAGADHVPFKLSSSNGETLRLYNQDGFTILDQVVFGPQTANISQGRLPDGGTTIVSFPVNKSTPAASNFLPISNVVINEVLSHTDPPYEDAVELYNPTTANVDISNWWLSDDRDEPKKYRFPAGTIIPAGGFKVVYERTGLAGGFNPNGDGVSPSFSFNSALGDEVNLFSGDASGNLTGYRSRETFGAAENPVSFGRYITSVATNFVPMATPTFGVSNPATLQQFRSGTGAANSLPKVWPIVISEIMYHPPDMLEGTNQVDNSDDEYIELHNITGIDQPLFDPDYPTNTWRLRNAVSFDFPMGVTLPPYGYLLVVSFDPATNLTQLAAFRSRYRVSDLTMIFGPYGGKLGNGGETLELKKPDTPQGPTHPDYGYVPIIEVERIKFDDDPPWPTGPDGTGTSLQRLDPTIYGNEPLNWTSGTPSPGADYAPNSAPVLLFIPDLVTNEFWPIVITNHATDVDLPAQNLVFTLEPGAPTNASISAEGVFQWRSLEHQGPGVYPITVRVTDGGVPSLSATQTFVITLHELNRRPLMYVRTQFTTAGSTLVFPTGYDTDIPTNKLTFTMDPGAPEGLALDPDTGVITWTPTDAQAPSTNYVMVRVEDDGAPVLGGAQRFTIVVLERNAILIIPDILPDPFGVVVRWTATLGKTYQVQYTDSLAPPLMWNPLGDSLTASGTNMAVADSPPARRMYRVLQLD